MELKDLISWDDSHEPVGTCHMTRDELLRLKDSPMLVDKLYVHTQAIERAVKEVREASGEIFGFEKRDGFIRARADNRKLVPKLTSKKDLNALFV